MVVPDRCARGTAGLSRENIVQFPGISCYSGCSSFISPDGMFKPYMSMLCPLPSLHRTQFPGLESPGEACSASSGAAFQRSSSASGCRYIQTYLLEARSGHHGDASNWCFGRLWFQNWSLHGLFANGTGRG